MVFRDRPNHPKEAVNLSLHKGGIHSHMIILVFLAYLANDEVQVFIRVIAWREWPHNELPVFPFALITG